MVKNMATRQGIKVKRKDRCAFCGEPLVEGLLSLVKARQFEAAWDGQRWLPYHRICWQQIQYRPATRALNWPI